MSNLWSALWQQSNKLDGKTTYLLRENLLPVIFKTRRECRQWINKRYGYIKTSKDLRTEPHGWRLPKPVKITVEQIK